MKRKLLKNIVTLAIILPCLTGCGEKYKEGEKVKAECVFNAFEEPVDYTKSFVIHTDEFKDINVSAAGNYFYIGDFKIYDSLYLADMNGDGYRDLCTDYLNGSYHGFAFYNLRKKEYIYSETPGTYSYYLGIKDENLILKEMYYLHSEDQEQLYYRRHATFLTAKKYLNPVWSKDDFKLYSFYTSMYYVTAGGGYAGHRMDDPVNGGQRHVCETNREFRLIFVYDYAGYLDKDSVYAKDCAIFEENPAYSVEFNEELTSLKTTPTPNHFYSYYNITFTEEGEFNIKVKIQDVEDIIKITVDNNKFNS